MLSREMSEPANATQEAAAERRRSARIHVRRAICLRWQQDGAAHEEATHTLCISRYGCGVACAQQVPPGTAVTLALEHGTHNGTVSYVMKNAAENFFELGIAFAEDGSAFWGVEFEPVP